MPIRSLAVAMVRHRGSRTDDLMVRAVGALVLLGIVLSLLDPTAAALTPFVLYTMLTNGPYSAVLPGAYEPVLLLYGQFFPPLLIAVVGTVATVFIEWVNYHLYGRARDTGIGRNLTSSRQVQRITRLFARLPFRSVLSCSRSCSRPRCGCSAAAPPPSRSRREEVP